jgi:hypothetical protein
MSRMSLRLISVDFQGLPLANGQSTRHTCDMDAISDNDLGEIVKQLAKRGGLYDPRASLRERLANELKAASLNEQERERLIGELHGLETPLVAHVRGEIRRCVSRLRSPPKLPDGIDPPRLTLADFRQAARALSKVAFTEAQQREVRRLEAMRQEPPEHANAFHYHCVSEAYYLMQLFSGKRPTLYEGGPFITIAVLLCDLAGGKASARSMRGSGALVLQNRSGCTSPNWT